MTGPPTFCGWIRARETSGKRTGRNESPGARQLFACRKIRKRSTPVPMEWCSAWILRPAKSFGPRMVWRKHRCFSFDCGRFTHRGFFQARTYASHTMRQRSEEGGRSLLDCGRCDLQFRFPIGDRPLRLLGEPGGCRHLPCLV